MNHNHPIYKAVEKLLDSVDATEGQTVILNVFIDGGRGDMYFEASNGHRVCVAANEILYCVGDWGTGARTTIS